MTTRKRCSRCRRLKTLDEFHRNKSNPDGHSYDCKACRSLGYDLLSDEEKRRRRALRVQRDGMRHHTERDKKRCVICHRIMLVTVFRPDRIEPDGGNECAECAAIRPWRPLALLRGRKGLLDHLAVYDEYMPIAAGLLG